MNKARKIQIKGLFLLLIYFCSNGPALLLHHHHHGVVPFSKADQCEKAIFYSEKEGRCAHKEHVSTAFEKCPLCDDHTLSVHAICCPDYSANFHPSTTRPIPYHWRLVSNTYSKPSNRGPPMV